MSGFFWELRRRKVYRVAAAYIVAAGFIIQIASAVFPAWELPNWSLRLMIFLILAGFPIALIFAWAFDVTPTGIERTPPVETASETAFGLRRSNLLLLAGSGILVSAAAGIFVLFFLLPHATAHKIDKSIAVLPFENRSNDQNNVYFADGIQDDILTNLSKIGDLKVISRTSVMSYRGQSRNIREIGKALGVSTILEGSVQREGNRVRVNVQLIDATTDEHIWANNYDRDLTDVFAIQTDLAHEIANALQAKLSPSEKARVETKPTDNVEAYQAFRDAHNFHSAYEDFEKLKQGEQMYERAITLDPKFALAFARYSQLESWIVHTFERTAVRRDKARALAESALRLQPELPEAHLAMGFAFYYIDNDYEAAAREFAIAQRGLPNEAEVYLAMGAIQRRQGKWAASNASLEKAVALNPKDIWAMQNLAINYEVQRNFEAANKTIDAALKVDPKALGLLEIKAKLAVEEKGDLSVAQRILATFDTMPQSPEIEARIGGQRMTLFFFLRQFDQAAREADKLPDSLVASFPGALCGKYISIGVAKKALHDEAGAREVFLKAKGFAENDIKQSPDDGPSHARLAEALAWLGEKDAALAAIDRALTLLPESKDAFGGPDITASAAQVHAITGDVAGAVAILDGLLSRPSPVTVPLLKLNPIWDSIRNDSRFQTLLQKYGART
jgi:TolB-like protein/cytochrome c-type biogenesis protein CcmH/NrfG